MTTETATKERTELEHELDALGLLRIATDIDYAHFCYEVGRLDGSRSGVIDQFTLNRAHKHIAVIEDAIKRYREGRPQAFQDKE